MNLAGKRILITGGGKRVGAALAKAFAGKGAEIVIHCFRSLDEAETLARSLPHASVICADLREPDCAEKILRAAGSLDMLVNNASIYNTIPLAEADRAMLDEMFQVNFAAPLALMQKFAVRKRPGVILNFLDQEVLSGHPARHGAYSLSRRSLAEATRALAREFAPLVRVNGIAPGPVLPPVFLPESRMEKTLKTLPLPHPVALDDLCAAALMLAENEAMTGVILPVDCGQSLL